MNKASPRFRLLELAERFDLTLEGDGNHVVSGIGTLSNAGPQDVSFLSNRKYLKQIESTRAGVVILRSGEGSKCSTNCLFSQDPYADYARIASLFDYRTPPSPGIHPTAVIDQGVTVGENVYIGPNVVVDAGTSIRAGSRIGPGCVIGRDCEIGQDSYLVANVTLTDRINIGKRVIIHPGAVIGADGFGLAFVTDHWEKVPQLGGVLIGDDCEIGANATIDRGAIEDTVLEDDVRLDNLVHIAHNVFVGAHTAVAACAGIAGSTRIGRNCLIGGGVGIFGHLVIADRVTISNMSTVTRDIKEEGSEWASFVPAVATKQWKRIITHWRKLDEYLKRIRQLEHKTGKNNGHD
ncbi:MAG: UDP-3-O-[3-hydroxymyristoyl] glucosamine N-acyltransferase [Lysobacterales bacterium]|jgi:UDP-3-O-[3-hydroxymyristoyl] glucosamine N-acyltransferase